MYFNNNVAKSRARAPTRASVPAEGEVQTEAALRYAQVLRRRAGKHGLDTVPHETARAAEDDQVARIQPHKLAARERRRRAAHDGLWWSEHEDARLAERHRDDGRAGGEGGGALVFVLVKSERARLAVLVDDDHVRNERLVKVCRAAAAALIAAAFIAVAVGLVALAVALALAVAVAVAPALIV